jgi:hypothetical protein
MFGPAGMSACVATQLVTAVKLSAKADIESLATVCHVSSMNACYHTCSAALEQLRPLLL